MRVRRVPDRNLQCLSLLNVSCQCQNYPTRCWAAAIFLFINFKIFWKKYIIPVGATCAAPGATCAAAVQAGLEARPASCRAGTRSLSQGQEGWDLTLATFLNLAPRLKKEQSYNSTFLWTLMTCSGLTIFFLLQRLIRRDTVLYKTLKKVLL